MYTNNVKKSRREPHTRPDGETRAELRRAAYWRLEAEQLRRQTQSLL